MKVLVLGAGVVGTTASCYLAKAGYEVTVLERQPGPGRGRPVPATMASGSGQLIADWMSGRAPQIDTDGLTLARYQR